MDECAEIESKEILLHQKMKIKINEKGSYVFTYFWPVSRLCGHPPMCPDFIVTPYNIMV